MRSARCFARTAARGCCGCPGAGTRASSGPDEIRTYGDAANPDPSELHNAEVEPICRKYLELRYRLMPYLYSVVREGCQTGLPVMRALWIHHPRRLGRRSLAGDEYLWGPNILVAPIFDTRFDRGASTCLAALWYDFWSGQPIEGGREFKQCRRSGDHAALRSRRHDPAVGPG